ncbi:MAG: LysM peptidoglycan-binding domain-containing protein [Kineosporiaceae bacterium]|nr:LysM peptidoglycan-binding domain-containing protein [Kineosporiaceae bacterium]
MRQRLLGSAAALTIVLLIVGVPWVLVAIGAGGPPEVFTSWARARSALAAPDDGTLLLALARLLAWAAWTVVAGSLLIEITSRVRGLPAPHLPALALPQGLARVLVSATAATFLATQPASALSTSPPVHASVSLTSVAAPVAKGASGTGWSTSGPSRPGAAAERGAATAARTDAGAALGAALGAGLGGDFDHDAPDGDRQGPVHVVASGETLWTIAERHLGDGARFAEIARLNYGREQPDGDRLTDSHWITPGWRLLLPSTAAQATGRRAAATRVVAPGESLWQIAEEELGDGDQWPRVFRATTATAQPGGDRLSDPDLLRPGWTVTIPAPDAVPAPATEPAPEPEPESETETETESPVVVEPRWGLPPTPGTSTAGDPTASPRPTPTVDAASVDFSPDFTLDASAVGEDVEDPVPWMVRTGGGVGALLAAGLIGTLGARRRVQRLRRRPGQRTALPPADPAVLATEHELRVVADPLGATMIDLALRDLARQCHHLGRDLPVLRAARLTREGLELFLAEPEDPPIGWTRPPGVGSGAVWLRPSDSAGDLDPAALGELPCPYPGLVTVGHDRDDAHFLVDLEYLGALGVDGDPAAVRAVLAALVVELATAPWSEDVQVTVVGDLASIEEVLGSGRIRYQPASGRVIQELAERAHRDREVLAGEALADVRTARARRQVPDTWTSEIVVVAEPATPALRRQLEEVLPLLAGTARGLVVAGRSPGTWTLTLPEGGLGVSDPAAVLEPAGVSLRPQRLDDATRHQVMHLIADADPDATRAADRRGLRPDGPADPGRHASDSQQDLTGLPSEPTLQELAARRPVSLRPPVETAVLLSSAPATVDEAQAEQALGSTPPIVRVLGPVRIEGATGPVETSRRPRLTELITYLALNPGVDHRQIDEAIWPDRHTEDNLNTRHTLTCKARAWLGRDDAQQDYLPKHAAGQGYRLASTVRTDWHLWLDLVGDDLLTASTENLESALALVRSRPFDAVHPKRYAWADRVRREMITQIVDVAYEVARRRLIAGRPLAAEAALAVGLAMEPAWEPLWRLRILAAHETGNRVALTEAVERLLSATDALGSDLEPETLALLEQVGRGPGDRPTRQTLRPR